MQTAEQHAKAAADAHTNLNTWGAIIALLEGGLLYGPAKSNDARAKVIALAKREQAKYLDAYDAAIARIRVA